MTEGEDIDVLTRHLMHFNDLRIEALRDAKKNDANMWAHAIADQSMELCRRARGSVQPLYEYFRMGTIAPDFDAKVVIIGGHIDTGPPPFDVTGWNVWACQRAVLHPEVRAIAQLMTVYDTRAWKILELDELEGLPTVIATPACLRAMQFNDFVRRRRQDTLFVNALPRFGAQGSGPYALSVAMDVLQAKTIVLHGFACSPGDTPYDYQRAFFEKLRDRPSENHQIYETPGSLLGIFPTMPESV